MAKSKRSNYLIDKPFQIGFIIKYLSIILITIIVVALTVGSYYWVKSFKGKYKLETNLTYSETGPILYKNKQVYDYDAEKIQIFKDDDGKYKVYKTFRESANKYDRNDEVLNVDEASLKVVEGKVTKPISRFEIILWPLLWTTVALLIIVSLFSIFFTHKVAGPIYRMKLSLDRMIDKDYDFKVKFRKNDFFQSLAERLEKLRSSLEK